MIFSELKGKRNHTYEGYKQHYKNYNQLFPETDENSFELHLTLKI